MIDWRSDTVTQPTPAMRQAMAQAPVGDDVLNDDPTVHALESRVAQLLGHQAAVYMPSGTMTNQTALRLHTQPGDEVILEAQSHIYYYEAGAPAALSGVMCQLIPGQHGIFTPDQLIQYLRPANIHHPVTKLLAIENTHNRGGGTVWPLDLLAQVTHTARQHKLKCHLDGARLWNAAVYCGVSEKEIAQHFDTVSVCFSKGLGAPVGSALVGSQDLIHRARRFRKMFGGGMRQAGIIAAGALYALDHHRDRLAHDHRRARDLAHALAALPGLTVNLDHVQTNMVMIDTHALAQDWVDKLTQHDILINAIDAHRLRAVSHLHIDDDALQRTIAAFEKIAKA